MKFRTIVSVLAAALTFVFCYELNEVAFAQQPSDQLWTIDSDEQWKDNIADSTGLELSAGNAAPRGKVAVVKSVLKRFEKKTSAKNIHLKQSPDWLNWEPVKNIGPANLGDAPVMLSLGPDNYWMFGRYKAKRNRKKGEQGQAKEQKFQGTAAKVDGFDVPLVTTPFAKQYDAPGGLQKRLGGYHAWQSKDMVNWIHHGAITESKARWMTTAEFANGKAYFYYDFPNDQDPHVYVDSDLKDGLPGEDKGIAYADPSHGSDSAIIRDMDGKFHLILEDWSPINARENAWDSPLAAHAVSEDGLDDFKLMPPPVDERTKPTGETATYKHPHWVKENPERFKTNVAEYQVHEPAQNAYGDWAAISIGGQYYLFCDFDPANEKKMSVGWFTSSSIDKPFKWCGKIGEGHPDPDIMFAEGRFYLATQQKVDYVSPGPWVDGVQVRVGVDTDNDQKIDKWTSWSDVKESYDYVKGFSKQVALKPAQMDLGELPVGFGFQFEIMLEDSTENDSKPVLDRVQLLFGN